MFYIFFYILTYEHGTRKEKIQKTERKTKHYTSQTNTQIHTHKKENKRNKKTSTFFRLGRPCASEDVNVSLP